MHSLRKPTLAYCAALTCLVAAATTAFAYTKPIPIPLPDGKYFSECGKSEQGTRPEYIALSGKQITIGWEEKKGQGISEFACQIRTRTPLNASKWLPRSEVFELDCTSMPNPKEGSFEDVLYLQSWSMREANVREGYEGDLGAVFLHFSYPGDNEHTMHVTHLARCKPKPM